ncbi:MAG: hypothetical protein ACKO5F_04230 [Synechococcus sp.]
MVSSVADQWGCSRRQARNVVNQALQELVEDTDAIQINQLWSDNIRRLQRLAMRAEQCGQFAAAVGAVRSLHEFAVAPNVHKIQRDCGWRA